MAICTVCEKAATSVYRSGVTSVYSSKKFDLLRCTGCAHFFTWPAPTHQELDAIYGHQYAYDAHHLIAPEKRMRAKRYAAFIASLSGAKSAFEIGCMHGLLLTELQTQGLDVSGVELDEQAVAHCQARGLNVAQSSVEDHLEGAGGQHDLVIMSHVIEHLAQPREQLERLRQKMPDGGRLILIFPNSGSWTRKLFGRYWGYWQVPVHINHFNESSISELLRQAGFDIQEVRVYGADSLFFLSSLANLVRASNNSNRLSPMRKLLVKISTVVLRPWYYLGSEDMLVLARKQSTPCSVREPQGRGGRPT